MKLTKINPEIEFRKMNAKNTKKSKENKTESTIKKEPSFEIKHIIIDCSCMNYVDSMGMNVIFQVRTI
jgi:hypothetical protein